MTRPGQRRCRTLWPMVAAGVLSGALAGQAPVAAAAAFVPHRAVYGLTLARASSGDAGITHAVGKLEFIWSDVCDGWAVSQRTHINLTRADGSETDFGWTLNSWESKDGLRYRFFIRRISGNGSSEVRRGNAQLDAPGGSGRVDYDAPDASTVDLPEGVIFPTRHSLDMLDAAGRGALPVWRLVFDGSGEEGIYGINAAHVATLSDGTAASFDFPLLRDVKSWRMSLAHFSLNEREVEPEHEQSLRLFENGVIDELLLDYGDFALDALLAGLEALPPADCEGR